MARAMQSNCFSLHLSDINIAEGSCHDTWCIPGREIFSAFGYGRVEVTEDICIQSFRVLIWGVTCGNKVHTAQGFVLCVDIVRS